MYIIDKSLISEELFSKQFVCDLSKCKGACCVEGDTGAPLALDEIAVLEEIYPRVKPYLSVAGQSVIEQKGTSIQDKDGDFCTPTINDRECAYSVYDENGLLQCGIELAHKDGQVDFIKPLSCHLYPVRITKVGEYDALNYERWEICAAACTLGEALKVPVYTFLRDALIRKYGQDFYNEMQIIEDLRNNPPS
ncbi:MAG: DUF3109 family protein [Cytophagales bacterium]|nr:MAG: DUF3109 family protein [Cytophagales bacterium]TAF60115.1 MAG: DUF3109 family protein [Cytophagales bacterium]